MVSLEPSSSIFSSKYGFFGAVVWLVQALLPAAIGGGTLFYAGEQWAIRNPAPPYDIDLIIVDEQVRRSWAGRDAKFVFIGDSSGLVGVNAARLTNLLGGRAESLATIARADPAGWAAPAERYVTSGGSIDTLVLLVHPWALKSAVIDPVVEQLMVQGHWPAGPFGTNLRLKIISYFYELLLIPFPSKWGTDILTVHEIRRRMREGAGTLIDPGGGGGDCAPSDYPLSISDAFRTKLPEMVRSIEATRARRVLVAITPIPQECIGPRTIATRNQVLKEVVSMIPRAAILDLPPGQPNELFASFTHLDADGRALYTELIAIALKNQP